MEETIRALQQLEKDFKMQQVECDGLSKEILLQKKEDAHEVVHRLEREFEEEINVLKQHTDQEVVDIEDRTEKMVSRSIEMLNKQYLEKKDTSLEQVIEEIIYYGNC